MISPVRGKAPSNGFLERFALAGGELKVTALRAVSDFLQNLYGFASLKQSHRRMLCQ